jgi:hypothetical protein
MFRGLGGVVAGGIITMWLYSRQTPLTVSVPEGAWGFGQFAAMLGVLSVGGQVWHYCVSPSEINPPEFRYQHWWIIGIHLTHNDSLSVNGKAPHAVHVFSRKAIGTAHSIYKFFKLLSRR